MNWAEAVRGRLAESRSAATPGAVAAALRAEESALGDTEVLNLAREVRADLVGAGPLEPLLRDPAVTDVLVNRPDEVWVEARGSLLRTTVRFPDERAVRRLAQRLAAAAGRRLDDAAPYVDARLPGGVRLHAVLAPVAVGGTCLSLRTPRGRAFTLPELVEAGSLSLPGADLLAALVASRMAFLVTGGTGTGKTTLLSCLLGLVPSGERLLLVEDSAELRPDHPHVVRLEARPPNIEGAGGVTLRDLVRQALRMRPDRLVVGEVRGPEVLDLLNALNTGHEGGCGTLHANTPEDVPARLEALGCAAGLSREALHSQLGAALDVVVHLERRGARRRVSRIATLVRSPSGLVEAHTAVHLTPTSVHFTPAATPLLARLGWPTTTTPGQPPPGPHEGSIGARAERHGGTDEAASRAEHGGHKGTKRAWRPNAGRAGDGEVRDAEPQGVRDMGRAGDGDAGRAGGGEVRDAEPQGVRNMGRAGRGDAGREGGGEVRDVGTQSVREDVRRGGGGDVREAA